jgi:hypothetical protein
MPTIFPHRLSFIAGSATKSKGSGGKGAQREPVFLIHTDNTVVAGEGTEEVPSRGHSGLRTLRLAIEWGFETAKKEIEGLERSPHEQRSVAEPVKSLGKSHQTQMVS